MKIYKDKHTPVHCIILFKANFKSPQRCSSVIPLKAGDLQFNLIKNKNQSETKPCCRHRNQTITINLTFSPCFCALRFQNGQTLGTWPMFGIRYSLFHAFLVIRTWTCLTRDQGPITMTSPTKCVLFLKNSRKH